MTRSLFKAILAFISIVEILNFGSASALAQTSSCGSGDKHVVCNIGWLEGCRVIPVGNLPACNTEGVSSVAGITPMAGAAVGIIIPAVKAIKPPSPINKKANEVLATLDAQPLDEAAQGQAREIIRKCNADGNAKTPRTMFDCSGFLVTPMVRLNCVGNGACMPIRWTLGTVADPAKTWALEVAYDRVDTSLDAGYAYARPWVSSVKDVEACRDQARSQGTQGTRGSNQRAALCLTLKMGGKPAQLAMSCFKQFPNNPVQYSGCLGDVKLDSTARAQANCFLRADESEGCLKTFGVPVSKLKACKDATPGNADAIHACMVSLPKTVGPAAECVRTYQGDLSATAHCLAGVGKMGSPAERAAYKCGMTLTGAQTGADAQIKVFECLAKQSPEAAQLAKSIETFKGTTTCLQDSSKDLATKSKCLRDAGVNFPKEAELAQCTVAAKTGAQLAECAGVKGAVKAVAMERCVREAADDNTRKALCVGMQVDMPADQRRILECAATSKNSADGVLCIAGPKLPRDVTLVASCAVNSQGSPTGMALCVAGPSMNAELRIAAECAASTGGEPMSFASCAGGRLTMKELQQCISGGFRAENGCFGDGNEIVKFYKAQEKVLRGVLRAAGLEKAYDNMLGDLRNGKLGENNEITRVIRLMNDIATKPPAETIANAIEDAKRAGKAITEGANKLTEEVNKVRDEVTKSVENALPKVPPVMARTDLPGGGSATVTVGPTGGTVTAGNNEVSIGSSPHIKVGGVCLGWGC